MKTITKQSAGAANRSRIISAAVRGMQPRGFGNIRLPEFANAIDKGDPIMGNDPGGKYRDGQVFFANDTRFTETFYSEPLTNYLVGWRDPNNIEDTLNFFAPAVEVGRRFEWKAAVNAEEFLSEVVDDERAIGADFKAVKYTATDVTDKTLNRGLTIIVDLDNVPGGLTSTGNVIPGWQQQRVAKLTRRLYRNSLRRALAAIAAAAVSTNYLWVAAAAAPGVVPVNPDQDVNAELIAATNLTGIRPNRVAYGDTAFLYRQQAYGAQNNPAGYVGYNTGAPEAAIASALQVDRVKISRERYQSGANAKTEILGNSVYSFFAMDGVDTEDPSNVKRFVTPFDAEQGGGLFRVYVQQISSKLVAITVEFYEKIVITYAGGIRQMVIANQ